MRAAADRLSVRWYLGYDLFKQLPDHSSLTRIRDRYELTVFRRFFERIVEMCFEAGLVRGEELFFDATKVESNASLDSMGSRSLVENRLEEHLVGIFPESGHRKGGHPRLQYPTQPRKTHLPLHFTKDAFVYDAEKDLYTSASKARLCAVRATTIGREEVREVRRETLRLQRLSSQERMHQEREGTLDKTQPRRRVPGKSARIP